MPDLKKTVFKRLVILFMTICSFTSYADEPQGWKFEVMPYLWYAGLEGDITVRGNNFDFEKSASDLVKAVDEGGSLLGAVQYNRYVLWGQADYFSLNTDELEAEDRPENVKFKSKMFIAEAAAGYQIDGWSPGQTFDLMIGGRTVHMENDVEILGVRKISKNRDLTDPMIFVRPSIPLFASKTNRLRFNPTLGFGGGGDSETVYELFPQIQYKFTDKLAARLGYRTIGWKVEEKDNELNIQLAGLIIGLGGVF